MNWDTGWIGAPRPPDFDPAIYNGGSANMDAANADRWPETYIWQLDIQKSFARNYMINVGYVGQSSHHIPAGLDLPNQVNPSTWRSARCSPPISPIRPWWLQATILRTQASRGIWRKRSRPTRSITRSAFWMTTGELQLQGLMIKAEKRFANGLQFLASFTASKTLTDVSMDSEVGNARTAGHL